MKVSLREFTRNPKKYVDTLPVDLTVYGKCVATIINFEGKVSTEKVNVSTQKENVTTQIPNVSTESVDTNIAASPTHFDPSRRPDNFHPAPKEGIK